MTEKLSSASLFKYTILYFIENEPIKRQGGKLLFPSPLPDELIVSLFKGVDGLESTQHGVSLTQELPLQVFFYSLNRLFVSASKKIEFIQFNKFLIKVGCLPFIRIEPL